MRSLIENRHCVCKRYSYTSTQVVCFWRLFSFDATHLSRNVLLTTKSSSHCPKKCRNDALHRWIVAKRLNISTERASKVAYGTGGWLVIGAYVQPTQRASSRPGFSLILRKLCLPYSSNQGASNILQIRRKAEYSRQLEALTSVSRISYSLNTLLRTSRKAP